jgi:uncharacterized protein (TIGR02271 family)
MDQWNIRQGSEVRSSDDEKLGKVVAMEGQYIVVEKGWLFPTDYFIPTSAISSVDDDTIYLSVSKDEALSSDWDQSVGAASGGGYADTTTGASYADTTTAAYTGAAGTETTAGADAAGTIGGSYGAAAADYAAEPGDVLRVPVHEEELTATTRPVEQGQVRIDKDVIAEEQTLEVPVTEERVRVTRRTVDREGVADAAAFEEGTIEVPVRGEVVDVEKRVRVAEEVEIAKEAEQRTERVTDTVRREQVRVEDETVDTTGI